MDAGRDEVARQHAVSAFVAELRHWREVAGYSQKALATLVNYTASYVSKVERGTLVPSRKFAEIADQRLRAGDVILRRWREMNETIGGRMRGIPRQESSTDDPQSAPSTLVRVEHEDARLTYRDGVFHTHIRRHLRNLGLDPVTQYLIRIAVDRYPGDPERSNRHYRMNPLTWDEIGLSARCEGEPMERLIKHDRDAFKEVWLLFLNSTGRFPLYPGHARWIEYGYSVRDDKWGPWWQRAIRLPTRRLTMTLDFPAALRPTLWGIQTSMTAEASPFRTPIVEERDGDRAVFAWSTEDPPLHARYRIEWKFPENSEESDPMTTTSRPSDRMRELQIVQEGDPILARAARRFDLPAEADDARRVVSALGGRLEQVARVHTFAKGVGLAAPQIGVDRAAAIVQPAEGDAVTLLNPTIAGSSPAMDERYEGCLSFFDVRGIVPRPLAIEVEHQQVDGTTVITTFRDAVARLVAHEIDHLHGILYRARMRPGVTPIPVSEYEETGRRWDYEPRRPA